ncbi:hypothetical protein DL762_005728 [Monosporascus cannonballus]|uniref:Calpain catalytic domain-containing protein n=1 Tax=Monosporascus cannonballus TaxID=155416 RepID=A0ABY0H409_9PEZI|nr:hypothetical protein DL763_009929 [Monosporascus cannonballus]RYO84287.1 hypothetical protein DL762_005728 [Monosporascus cannonballus]
MSALPPSESSYLEQDRELGASRTVIAEMPVTIPTALRRPKKQTPQEAIDEFWSKFTTKTPGKATTVIPHNEYIQKAVDSRLRTPSGKTTQASYEEAAAVCRAKIDKIVKECRRINQKYRDPHFDLELDLKWGKRDTLETLCNTREKQQSSFRPRSVKRVVDIFDDPKFYIDGPSANDVRQGRDGDCWLLAALCTLSNKPSLIERVCVARDEAVGVYGFVFHRDGEWISEIIDDKLFLTKPDFDESFLERMLWEDRERVNSEEQYRRAYQSGSGALYFAQCEHADETWLPLLEKAYAKAHGDYAAIEGGFTGEGIEDLTGGVTSELYTTDILDKEYFWKEELMKVNDEFLFGCNTDMWGAGRTGDRNGIVELHAYSVMRAVEMDGQRLVLLKNPWGKFEWKGPWSDGSKEWTAEWLIKLNHRFGDDGAFWISYNDLLRKYQVFDRTRLFGPEWKVASLWTTVSVPWTLDYLDTHFTLTLAKPGPVVLVLSQLDDRYYRGLEGQYRFELNFRLHKTGQEDYVVRTISPYCQNRSVNVELELEAGEYAVLLKINATRDRDVLPIEDVVRNNARDRRDKLVAVGMSYDLAHSKGQVRETPEERRARRDAERRRKDRARGELRKATMRNRENEYYLAVKRREKRKKRDAKVKARAEAKKAEKTERAKARKAAKEAERAKAETRAPKNSSLSPIKEGVDPNAASEAPIEDKEGKHVHLATPGNTPVPDAFKKDTMPASSSGSSLTPPSTATNDSPGDVSPTSESPLNAKIPAPGSSEKPVEESKTTEGEQGSEKAESGTVAPVAKKPKGEATAEADAKTEPEPGVGGAAEDLDLSTSDSESYIPSISSISDRELDIQLERMATMVSRRPPVPAHARRGHQPPEDGEESPDEFESDPWNAVATVGLRVYHKVSEEDRDREMVQLRVVRPNPYLPSKGGEKDDGGSKGSHAEDADDEGGADQDEDKGKEKKGGKEDGKDTLEEEPKSFMGLDVDDSSKDATLVGDQEQRKSILALVPQRED